MSLLILSLFIAVSKIISIPFIGLSSVVYILFCTYFFIIAYSIDKFKAYAAYIILLFNPYRFIDYYNTRIVRSDLNSILVIGIFTFLLRLLYSNANQKYTTISILGFLLGIFALNREENIILLPIISHSILFFFLQKQEPCIPKKIVVLVTWQIIPLLCISIINYAYYKAFTPTEFYGTAFSKSISILAKIKSKNTRYVLYQLSPTFKTLEQELEGDTGYNWAKGTTFITNMSPNDREVGGDFFRWTIRDAVANIGVYSSFTSSEKFYNNVFIEISELCQSKKLNCRKNIFMNKKILKNWISTLKSTVSYMEGKISFANGENNKTIKQATIINILMLVLLKIRIKQEKLYILF